MKHHRQKKSLSSIPKISLLWSYKLWKQSVMMIRTFKCLLSPYTVKTRAFHLIQISSSKKGFLSSPKKESLIIIRPLKSLSLSYARSKKTRVSHFLDKLTEISLSRSWQTTYTQIPHTHKHTHEQSYKQTHLHTNICTYIHTYIHAYLALCVCCRWCMRRPTPLVLCRHTHRHSCLLLVSCL